MRLAVVALPVFLLGCLMIPVSFCHAQSTTAPDPSQPAGAPATAQAPPAKPPAGQSASSAQPAKDSDVKANGGSNDRLFFALPNFLTVENAANVPPLSAGGKFGLVARSAFDPVQFVWYGALSGISQAENSEPGFGQGAAGYGKRYGAYLADGTIENFMVGAVFPAALHQDPRFFQLGQGSFFHRTGYALSRAVIIRTDSGRSQFNYSEIFGSALASAISTYSYHPHPGYHPIPGENVPYIASDRTLTNTASVWATQVGYDTLTFVIKEFWPDVRRKIRKQHNSAVGGPSQP